MAVALAPVVPASTATSSGTVTRSSSDELVRLDLAAVQRDQYAVQRARPVVAPRVDCHRPPDLAEPGRLVDVPMQSQERLSVPQRVPDGRASHRAELHLPRGGL